MSCVPVYCAEIRCLSGPVTVYNIIFGDGDRGDVFISLLSSRRTFVQGQVAPLLLQCV